MIILEGPDGAGKTTLMEELREKFPNVPIAPRVVNKNTEAMTDLNLWVQKNVIQGFQAKFFDRHRLISEPIYGAIIRQKSQPGFNDFSWLYPMMSQFYNNCDPLIIYCLPPYELVYKFVQYDPENTRVRGYIRKIYDCYVARASIDCSTGFGMVWDFTHPDNKQMILNAITKKLETYSYV